jgi:hypothetical protein
MPHRPQNRWLASAGARQWTHTCSIIWRDLPVVGNVNTLLLAMLGHLSICHGSDISATGTATLEYRPWWRTTCTDMEVR